jgi:hypothetical protein
MAWRQTFAGLTGAALALLGIAAPALAGGDLAGYERRPAGACPMLLSAEGCYWNRGERYCSRYCYIEVNGSRYCHQRQSEAVPQAGCDEPDVPEPVYRRPRHNHRYYR